MAYADSLGTYYNRAAARYPHYTDRATRVGSFVAWPADRGQTPEDLADAGFFHTGNDDCTRCFYCGGGLRNWLPGDLPFVEHARWFQDCQFVRSIKGDEFVDNVHINHPRTYPNQEEPPEEESRPLVLDEIVERVIQKPCGEALLVLGFPPHLVRAAITNVLSAFGWEETQVTGERLAPIVLELQDVERDAASAEQEKSHSVSFRQEKVGVAAMSAPPPPPQATPNTASNPGTSTGKTNNVVSTNSAMSSLLLENQRLKEQMKCKVCLDRDVTVAFLPCGHLVSCAECCLNLTHCPLCRATIAARVKTYM